MPLLGKKPFVCSKPLTDIQPDETIYIIPHTKEQFKSKQEYEKRLSWYKQPIWTCRCTGHVNLSHQEAWESEKAIKKSLKDNFSKCHEKPVLELVHHSTSVLDTLVDQAWLKIQQVLSVNEKVSLKVKAAGKTISGKVVKIDKAGVEANPTSNCSSPSSDKENSTTEVNRDSSPKKWVPPKLLQYKYSVELEDGKVINSVPADDLVRGEKPPSKECLRHFIRCYAVRSGQNPTCPWVVDSNKVKDYSIASKFADFLVSPVKMAEVAKRAEEEMSKKRKSSSHGGSAAKKAKIDKQSKKNSAKKDNKKQLKLTGSPLKKKPSSSPKKFSGAVVVSESSSEDDVPLSQRAVSPKKKKSPSKKVKSDSIVLDSDSDDECLSSKEKSPKKKAQHKKIPNGDISSDSDEESVPLAKIKSKSMKQMTLFDMSKKKGMKTPEKKKSTPTKKKLKLPEKGLKTPDKKPKVMSPPKTPAVVSKLVHAVKANDKGKIKGLLETACKVLTPKQREKLPTNVKEMVESSIARREEKRKLDSMTPEQREEYMKQKRLAQKRKRQEELKEKKKKYEDTELDLEPLPEMKIVSTPDGLPNELFGDVAMVTEFISCYQGLLIPNKEFPVSSEKLMQSMAGGKDGFFYLSKILAILLQTLLQDQISEDYQEMKIPLSDIAVNSYTTSELVRLCLRKQDVQEDHDSDSDDSEAEDEVPEEIIQLLESQELYDLDAVQKVKILKGLCLRIMGTYSVQDYMEQKQNEATQLWKKKMAELKKKNDKIRKEKELKKEKGDKSKQGEEKTSDDKEKSTSKDVLLTSFYGKANASGGDSSKGTTPEVSADEGTDGGDQSDLASVVKRRRLLAVKAAAEKEKKDQERREQKQKEYEEYMEQKERLELEKAFTEGIGTAKHVLRVAPVGTDRNHNRYWVFSKATPGIYIEKGWVTEDIDYCCQKEENSESEEESSDEDTKSKSQDEDTATKPQSEVCDEKTVPHTGQNLWFTYNTLAEIDELLKKLHPQGYRESQLKDELKKRYDDLSKGLNGTQQPKKIKTEGEEEEEEDLIKAFRKELLETEIRLKNGGLGGVPDFDTWDARLETATEIADLGQLMIETQENILEKFRQGIMANKRRKPKYTEVKVEEEEEDLDDSKEEESEVTGVANWREAVKNCPTLSRLHVLIGMLDSCIKWEKSAENVKCKICRKKTDESKLLLCDECNQPFHMFCLRPALLEVPEDDWFCAACVPKEQRRKGMEMPADSEDEEDDDVEHDETCIECGGDEGLIFCSECPSAYHLDCHNPPLRREPRGKWSCNDCKLGIRRTTRWRSKKREAVKNKRAAPKRKSYKEWSTENSDEDESEEEAPRSGRHRRATKHNKNSSDSEEEAPSRGRRGRGAQQKQESSDSEEEEAPTRGRRGRQARQKQEDSEESEEESDVPPARGRRGRAARKHKDDSDESEAENRSSTRRSNRARKTYKEASESDSESEEEEDEETTSRKRKRGRPSKGKKEDSDSEEEQPPAKAARKSRQQSSTRSKKGQMSAKSSPVIEEKKATSRRAPSDLSICEQIVANLMKHKSCWPFLNPVNKKEVPDYYEIIKHPLDFQIVKDRLQCLVYGSVEECLEDVKLVFNNCETYNPEGSEILECMREVEDYFRGQMEKYLPQVLYYRKTLTNGH